MLGFSLTKILLLIFTIGVVWYFFRTFDNRRNNLNKQNIKKQKKEQPIQPDDITEMQQCPDCQSYFSPTTKNPFSCPNCKK